MKNYFNILLVALAITACSPSPKTFDKLHITDGESGLVPLSKIESPPAQEDTVVWFRSDPNIVKAYIRKKISCPDHASRSFTANEIKSDKILLCYKLMLDAPDQVTDFYGACPQDLLLQYEFIGIPPNVEPKFEISQDCKGI